ncbi:MAG: type I glyceraldehyde-3-phosphate dehydrogenase [Firmicutes bacterium]|mgnify:CR=1 FL=1|jgi:glyceraldehyde 3-phosphate dehydrogenase|nr:type I glyceraldehyde-3-phosphate dehydrogenase [Bacillota bacterium]
MAVKVGINGFGRVAKACLRASLQHPEVEVVAVNSIRDPKLLAHLLKYDTVYGTLEAEVEAKGQSLIVDGREIKILAQRDPALLNWSDVGADIVLEATGAFNQLEKAEVHLKGGAKRVVITAPVKGDGLTVVMGVNESDYDPAKHYVVSNASCTTNCLAVVAKVLHERMGIKRGLMTTIHAYTNDQRILDITHNDFRRARAAAVSMIPTTTGAARNVGLVLPELQGKINGTAVRVPTFTVSLVDLVAELEKSATAEEINAAFEEASQGELKGYLGITFEPLVSIDFKQNSCSGVVDALSTMVLEEKMVKVLAWYDNEWGYCVRVLDLAAYIAGKGL